MWHIKQCLVECLQNDHVSGWQSICFDIMISDSYKTRYRSCKPSF